LNVKLNTHPFHYLEVKDLFTKEESDKILSECLYYESQQLLKQPENTGTAKADDGTILKRNKGIFLDEVYQKRELSPTLNINRKFFDVFNHKETTKSWYFHDLINLINADSTLLSYYENADYYKPHIDKVFITGLTWFYKEPKKFKGGNLVFTDHNIEIECRQNYTILFPSNTKHAVTEVKLPKKYLGQGLGRFTMTQFCHINM